MHRSGRLGSDKRSIRTELDDDLGHAERCEVGCAGAGVVAGAQRDLVLERHKGDVALAKDTGHGGAGRRHIRPALWSVVAVEHDLRALLAQRA